MIFDPTFNLSRAQRRLQEFISLTGEAQWRRRTDQLLKEASRSYAQEIIMHDHHWLEMILAHLAKKPADLGEGAGARLGLAELAALHFVDAAMEIESRLSSKGQNVLRGRLTNALKSDSGFAPLHLEIEIGILLLGEGYEIDWPDMEQRGRVDIGFKRGAVEGEVECKSLSADAGRKVHRKDFYRFVESLDFTSALITDEYRIMVVTAADRFPVSGPPQAAIRAAVENLFANRHIPKVDGSNFEIIQEKLEFRLGPDPSRWHGELHNYCRARYGANVHVSGQLSAQSGCLVAARSMQEDDTTLPLLDAIKKAATQLTGEIGIVAIQFNDLPPAALASPHVQERNALVSSCVFGSRSTEHLTALYFCAYGGLQRYRGTLGTPGSCFTNMRFADRLADLPFQRGLSDTEFPEIFKAGAKETTPVIPRPRPEP